MGSTISRNGPDRTKSTHYFTVTLQWALLVIIAADREGVHRYNNFTTTITCVPKHWSTINILTLCTNCYCFAFPTLQSEVRPHTLERVLWW